MNKFDKIQQRLEKRRKTEWKKHIPKDIFRAALAYDKLEKSWDSVGNYDIKASLYDSLKDWRKTSWGMDLIEDMLNLTSKWSYFSEKMSQEEYDNFMDTYTRAKRIGSSYGYSGSF